MSDNINNIKDSGGVGGRIGGGDDNDDDDGPNVPVIPPDDEQDRQQQQQQQDGGRRHQNSMTSNVNGNGNNGGLNLTDRSLPPTPSFLPGVVDSHGGRTAVVATVPQVDHGGSAVDILPPDVLQLWAEVAKGLEVNQTVVWTNAVRSLQAAKEYLPFAAEARAFVDKYALQIVSIMLEQVPAQTEESHRRCVEQSLQFGAMLVSVDLEMHNQRFAQGVMEDCKSLAILQAVFDKTRVYYKGNRNNSWRHHNINNISGRPEVRLIVADCFRKEHGFERLCRYMMDRVALKAGPTVDSKAPAADAVEWRLANTGTALMAERDENNQPVEKSPSAVYGNNTESTSTTIASEVTVKPQFLSWELIRIFLLLFNDCVPPNHILLAAFYPQSPEAVAYNRTDNNQKFPLDRAKAMADASIMFASAYMEHIMSCSEDELKKIPPDHLTKNQKDLQRIFDRLIVVRRKATYEFFAFWRQQTLTYVQSQSLPLRLVGWSQLDGILAASDAHRPPPRSYKASGAGVAFVNGEYNYKGLITPDGYAYMKPSGHKDATAMDICYRRVVPGEAELGGGKELTLFRCSMRSQQKWWFLSEADEEQPGTDRDIDYYQHKSKAHEERQPPSLNWSTCPKAGREPPPKLEPMGLMVADGEECNTLEHQLAKWAIENRIIEHVLGDSVHREIVSRSTRLLKFLASMCERDEPTVIVNGITSKEHCLQSSHLLLAWKTCTRKTDAAVSAQIYQLLVSILPSCPSGLAIPLLKAIQDSLVQTNEHMNDGGTVEKQDFLSEVADFCTALATGSISEGNNDSTIKSSSKEVSDSVREEVLDLFWSVFTHPDVSSLKSYDVLKQYVTNELKVEPLGAKLREKYLRFCVDSIHQNSKELVGPVDEVQALRMVRLTNFVLQACPKDQASRLVMHDNGALSLLLTDDLSAFFKRRESSVRGQRSLRKSSSFDCDPQVKAGLSDRLRIIRNVYGMNDDIFMSKLQIKSLWQQCQVPSDREEVMVFINEASGLIIRNKEDQALDNTTLVQPIVGPSLESVTSSAFTAEVSVNAFLTLFCSPALSFHLLGERAYQSFKSMFDKLKNGLTKDKEEITRAAMDTLWRICLETKSDDVATQAMQDLLAIYSAIDPAARAANTVPDPMQTDLHGMDGEIVEDNFGKRVFECLSTVKSKLAAKDPSAELATERCLRILNAAIGQTGPNGSTATSSTMVRLCRPTTSTANLRNQMIKYLPHGMRGQACYRKITITAKRQIMQGQQGQAQLSFQERDQANLARGRNGSNPIRFQLDVHPLETLYSIKKKVATHCQCPINSVKAVNLIGHGPSSLGRVGDGKHAGIGTLPEDTVVDEAGVIVGSEIIYIITERQSMQQQNTGAVISARAMRNAKSTDLSEIFLDDTVLLDKLFNLLLSVLELLPWRDPEELNDTGTDPKNFNGYSDGHQLVWDLLLSMPTNGTVETQVMFATRSTANSSPVKPHHDDGDAMDVDQQQQEQSLGQWSNLLDLRNFHQSVYVLLAIDAFLQPAVEVLTYLPPEQRTVLAKETIEDAIQFRKGFITSGGFAAVVDFVSLSESKPGMNQQMARMGNAVALRILKQCVFGERLTADERNDQAFNGPDEIGSSLLQSLSNARGLLQALASMVVADSGVLTSTIADVLQFLHLLFQSSNTAQSFVSLPRGAAEKFIVTLLLWETPTDPNARPVLASYEQQAAAKVRITTKDLVIRTPALSDQALSWLVNAIDFIEVTSEATADYFDLLGSLISDSSRKPSCKSDLTPLATAVCRKLASCRRPTGEAHSNGDSTTAVLCGCLFLLRNLIESAGGDVLKDGTSILVDEFKVSPWSSVESHSKPEPSDAVLIDLMGVIFDSFLSPGGATSILAICSDSESKSRGFEAISTAIRTCKNGHGFRAIVSRVNGLVAAASPSMKHHWGQSTGENDGSTRHGKKSSQYSGLHNQGCTCYMNSVLQQLFMMPELRKSLCSAPLPQSIRASGRFVSSSGAELIGKEVRLHWENGSAYHAKVEEFNRDTGTHVIRYCPVPVASVGQGIHHNQIHQEQVDDANFPPFLLDEFVLSEGRPGKETGVFEILDDDGNVQKPGNLQPGSKEIEETEDEASSRHLMEEVQRTFIHLEEGSRGRWFDPRALVEACACLKLEFDVWQQNDASEFATKLLDRLETSLKRWAPDHFRYLDHTFGLKQTKQKICNECGMKSNREEKLLSVDCQIRGKADIHEALATMCETEIMEGSNQVFCDNCKKKTDTVLRTAISELPNMLILSLKRFDLDYNTFETVKLNSRCAFGQTLNMKRYTLEGLEAMEKESEQDQEADAMDTGVDESALQCLPNEDYEYKLAGVLVHSGVAQGGHYYSFIKDRNPGASEKWYRFDDEDVTSFDPAAIETECFGGKVKKETKWPNGQVQTVESDQFANALMLFYEKVKPTEQPTAPDPSSEEENKSTTDTKDIVMTSGYDVFEPDVSRSNATHRWQSFLFDKHFQKFLRGLLGLCKISIPSGDAQIEAVDGLKAIRGPWRRDVLQMLVAFIFDVYLYGEEKDSFSDWRVMTEDILFSDHEFARDFVDVLAKRSRFVNDNWFRTYLFECPDAESRLFAASVFAKSFCSAIRLPEERTKLAQWTNAWNAQVKATMNKEGSFPAVLLGELSMYEDIESTTSSRMGILLSHLNQIIEASPRQWIFNINFALFAQFVAQESSNDDDNTVRNAIIACLIPARLVCLVGRQQIHSRLLRAKFPAITVSRDVAETQIRAEQIPQQMMTHNQVLLHHSNQSYRGGRDWMDYAPIVYLLGFLLRIPGLFQAELTIEQNDQSRGRQRRVLSPSASNALKLMFRELCSEGCPGMSQQEIESHLLQTRVEVSEQRIIDLMSRYPASSNNDGIGDHQNYLSLDGFLEYYRGVAIDEDFRLKEILHKFGFRPDLTRRSENARVNERNNLRSSIESVAIDVIETMCRGDVLPSLGEVTDIALQTFRLHEVASHIHEPTFQYLIAATTVFRKSDEIIADTLRGLVRCSTYSNQDATNAAIDTLRLLALIPDSFQPHRIDYIMTCDKRYERRGEHEPPLGLCVAPRHISQPGRRDMYNHHQHNEMQALYERYVCAVKAMLGIQPVLRWLNDNRPYWSFMEREISSNRNQRYQHPQHGAVQSRGDYSVQRGADPNSIDIPDHNQHSDSDNLGIGESEDDDDSALHNPRYDEDDEDMMKFNTPSHCVVNGAGSPDVDGEYKRDNDFEGAFRFSKEGQHNGRDAVYSIFRCNVSNNTQHWYISVVPIPGRPGTSNDIDFYSAPAIDQDSTQFACPPERGWVKAGVGMDPPPTIEFYLPSLAEMNEQDEA